MRWFPLLPLLLMSFISGASSAAPDPHSYANADQVRIQHLELDLEVDFATRRLHGVADLKLKWRGPGDTVVLDTRDLEIVAVSARRGERYVPARFRLAARDPIFGQRLSVAVPRGSERLRVVYRTAPDASGLQWLAPAQTAGRRHPFLYSQSQAIHARSWVPLMDTPAVRFTYRARVKVPRGLRALMSADNRPEPAPDGVYAFEMPQAIPSYLLALAVGELGFHALGPRSGVYAEPATLARAADELADTERMIEIAEGLYGPYRWGRYDLLVLPPAFPFGGMENPRLTFLTPTFIAGDRSLVALIAHELAHSWSGNLVTNAGWNHFWLNEGFTVYVEGRIVEALYGRAQLDMERVLARTQLKRELERLPPGDQRLLLNLARRDPDDGLTAVAYQKGAAFLEFLEERFGREHFDPFLRAWFDRHAFQSATTAQFLDFLERELMARHPGRVRPEEIDAFVNQPGLPAFAPRPRSTRLEAVDSVRSAWLDGSTTVEELPVASWVTQEWVYFIEGLPRDLDQERLAALDRAFGLSSSTNAEIAHYWFRLAISAGYAPAMPALERYLLEVGRRRLILPLYELLAATPAGRERARAIYARARSGYHAIAQGSIDALLADARRK